MDLGPHAVFILAAYAATAAIIGALIARSVIDHRAQVRTLAELEGRGARRRSQREDADRGPEPREALERASP